jgi:hypothetical protein
MMRKTWSLLVVFALVASSLIMAVPVQAELPKPSVPDFTLRYVENSNDVPATYDVDPYTGKTVMIKESYHIQNNSVQVVIKNQPYTSYRNENAPLIWLYYSIAQKGHFESWGTEDWHGGSITTKIYDEYLTGYIVSSKSDYTIVSYGIAGNNGTNSGYSPLVKATLRGQVDFKVQAIIGYSTRFNESFSGPPIGLEPGESYHYYIFTGESSDWSSTQTVTIGDTAATTPSTTASPTMTGPAQPSITTITPEETQTDLPLSSNWETVAIVGLTVAVAVLAAGLLVVWRRLASLKGSASA